HHYGFSRDEFLQMTMDGIEVEDETGWQVRPATSSSHPPVRKHRKKDGTLIDIELHSHSVKIAGIEAVLLAAQDVTMRNLMEVALRQGQKMQAVGELASGIAHEINTPIQFVGDNIRFMQDSFGDLMALVDRYQQLADKAGDHCASELLTAVREAEQYADVTFL